MDQPSENALKAERTFIDARLPGEVILRYRAPMPVEESFLSVWRSSKNRWWLFAFGGGWLMSFAIAYLTIWLLYCSSLMRAALTIPAGVSAAFLPLVYGLYLFAIILPFLATTSVVLYSLFVYTCLRLCYDKDWLEAIMGPTHIGLSSSGIKLSWKTNLVSFYGPMVSWNDLSEVEGSFADSENPGLVFKFNRNGADAQFVIDPNGFLNKSEKEFFLSTIENCVPKSALYPDARNCITRARTSEPIVVSDSPDQISEQQSQEFTKLMAGYNSSTSIVPGDNPVLSIEDKNRDQSEVIQQSIKLKKTSKQHTTK